MRLYTKKIYSPTTDGFSLVEVMITLAIAGIITGGIYSAYLAQQKSYYAQEQVAEMQQNLRAAIDLIALDIKMAGYDSTGDADSGITTALSGQMSITQDLNNDGDLCDANEVLDFGFSADDDAVRDGMPDAMTNGVPNAASLGRQSGDTISAAAAGCPPSAGGGYQAIAENIQAIEFLYTMADGTQSLTPAILSEIRDVQITILARAGQTDRNFFNTFVYCPASNPLNPATGLCTNPAPAAIWGPFNDNYRRRLLVTAVQCRNMGL